MSKVLKGFQENFSRQNQNSNVASGSSHQATLNNEPGPMDVDVHHEYLDVDMVPPPMPPAPPPKSPTPPPHPPTPPPPIERPRGLPPRVIRLPQRFRDEVPPEPPLIIPPVVEEEPPQPQEPPSVESLYRTPMNGYGIFREYTYGPPSITPDEHFTLSSVSDSPNIAKDPADSLRKASEGTPMALPSDWSLDSEPKDDKSLLFKNRSTQLIMSWFYNGHGTKSYADTDKLIHQVVLDPDFDPKDFDSSFSTAREAARLDEISTQKNSTDPTLSEVCRPEAGWIKGSFSIPVPCDGFIFDSEEEAPQFVVENVMYRKPLEVIKQAFAECTSETYTTIPYREFWRPSPDEPPERLFSESYVADIFNEEYEKIKSEPRTGPHRHLEPFVVGIGIFSDSTHLTSFGDASIWPILMYILNQSKYTRGKPKEFAAHHIAYIPKLTDTFQDWHQRQFGKAATSEMLTHMRREVNTGVWGLLLDEDVKRAYAEGEAVELADRVCRAMYLRFIFSSNDYPEKMLQSCCKCRGTCLCPRCLIQTMNVPKVGSKMDMRNRLKLARVDSETRQFDIETARKALFLGKKVNSKAVNGLLQQTSAFPTRNAFSKALFEYGFNFYRMFTVDFMHEVELGVWKALFSHLLRILYTSSNQNAIATLNKRYRQVSPFGLTTIRRFARNASDMKKLAARDFEDLLQCSIPVFEGLLPEPAHNKIIQNLLFEMATWHALAKLRLHTDTTLDELGNSCTRLCDLLRQFQKEVCSQYATRELPSETAARGRRQAAKAKKAASAGLPVPPTQPNEPKTRTFNMQTYKLHSLPDYVDSIRQFGTTDGTSTQMGESEHKRAKLFYKRVKKGDHIRGIAKHIYRERVVHRTNRVEIRKLLREDRELLEPTPPDLHYHISSDVRRKLDILPWMSQNQNDPATRDFMLRLKTHLYACLSGVNEFSDSIGTHERLQITILGDRIYEHQVLRINYTSYDMRRIQDTLKPNSSRCDIMVLASNKGADQQVHPYWYARIIGIYHANVVISTPDDYYRASKHKVDFLHVRWLGVCEDCHYGWKYRRLPQLAFGDINDSASFGFVDPSLVLRATHLIPRFILGKIPTLGPSVAYRSKENNEGEEWERYYVNFFVDRDMVMLYRGGGVGHASTRAATDSLRQDRRADDIASRKKRREAHEAPDPDLEPDGASDQEQDAQDQAEVAPENSADSDDNEDDSDQHTDSEEEEEEESDEDEDRGDLDELGFAEY
ncbi:hypothetical protein JR316_0009313 [Psilocybe cubensis]|uniref:Uncharacterized protein n=1 Tax=Psilocybe cubensis TaxID=181762 RepID=A0ACB8GT59_PSICU|nr:hypothetical protein JR316_0009313 [Psilocybe cubensis]KAH9478851.1 hypothetical protein JR316_0009313 [Psilocybe cubensis]